MTEDFKKGFIADIIENTEWNALAKIGGFVTVVPAVLYFINKGLVALDTSGYPAYETAGFLLTATAIGAAINHLKGPGMGANG